MEFFRKKPRIENQEWVKYFAWKPVPILYKPSSRWQYYYVWLEYVERKKVWHYANEYNYDFNWQYRRIE